MSADGLNNLLQQALQRAAAGCPSLAAKHVTLHMVRHSIAVHPVQSGVDITVIAFWLGHESLESTHIYLEADLETKGRALQKIAPGEKGIRHFKAVGRRAWGRCAVSTNTREEWTDQDDPIRMRYHRKQPYGANRRGPGHIGLRSGGVCQVVLEADGPILQEVSDRRRPDGWGAANAADPSDGALKPWDAVVSAIKIAL